MLDTWTQFTRNILIDKSIEEIYPLWTTSKGLTSWFLRKADYHTKEGQVRIASETYVKGDTYTWKWHNWDGEGKGKVLEQNNTDHLSFEFEGTVVEVRFSTFEDGRTLINLVQSKIRLDEKSKLNIYCGCSAGWTFWLTNLKAYCEHGILLNERGQDLMGKFKGYALVNT